MKTENGKLGTGHCLLRSLVPSFQLSTFSFQLVNLASSFYFGDF